MFFGAEFPIRKRWNIRTQKRARGRLLVLVCVGLFACSGPAPPSTGEMIYTGGPTWTGKWVKCDHWEAGAVARCSILVGDDGPRNISAVGDFLLVAEGLWGNLGTSKASDGNLAYSFLGETLFVGPKGLFLLPLDVTKFLYGEKVGFIVATEGCRNQVRSGNLEELWRSLTPMKVQDDAERGFRKFVSDPNVSGRAASFALQDFRAGSRSGDRWIHVSWLDGASKHNGMLVGDCWGSFSTKPAP